jgi:hypothetical protein
MVPDRHRKRRLQPLPVLNKAQKAEFTGSAAKGTDQSAGKGTGQNGWSEWRLS